MNENDLLDVELEAALHGDFEKSEAILKQLVTVYPDDHRANFNYGWFLLMKGEFQKGYELLEHGRHINVYGNGRVTNKPIWNPRYHLLKDKTIVLALEGGFGDEMMMARFVYRLHELGGKVIMMGNPGLHNLLKTVPNVERVISILDIPDLEFDYWLPGFSAGWVSGYNNETLYNDPYLKPNLILVQKWAKIINGNNLKIGIRWSGNPEYEHQQYRRFSPNMMIDLTSENASFFSLQRDTDLISLPAHVTDLKDLLTSWDETAAAIANLDLVISSCTSVAHLAAAMGKPTWILVPTLAYHCWALPGRTSPWYQTVRLFRQKKFGEWNDTFKLLRKELAQYVANPQTVLENQFS